MCAHTRPQKSIFDGPITNLLSVQYILIEIFSRTHEKVEKDLNDFKFGTFTGHFQNDGMWQAWK